MSLTLGKSFNRQIKMRLPFQNYFYDIGIFYTTSINFNLFDIRPIYKHGSNPSSEAKINMFKNIEASDFCTDFLEMKIENDRPSRFIAVKDNFQADIYCDFIETIMMSNNNNMKIYLFSLTKYDNDFLYILVERKNISKVSEDKVISTLSGIQITTSTVNNYLNELKKVIGYEN